MIIKCPTHGLISADIRYVPETKCYWAYHDNDLPQCCLEVIRRGVESLNKHEERINQLERRIEALEARPVFDHRHLGYTGHGQ